MTAKSDQGLMTPKEERMADSPIPDFDWLSTGMQAYYIISALVVPMVVLALAIAIRRGDREWWMSILIWSLIPPFNLLAGLWFAVAYLIIYFTKLRRMSIGENL